MRILVLSMIALTAAVSTPATAQTAPHEVKAREIYARIVSFRASEGTRAAA